MLAQKFNPREVKQELNSMLRGLIVSEANSTLFVGDLSSIEARLTFWLAGDYKTCQDYNNKIDLYQNFGNSLPLPKIYDLKQKRQLGKQGILSLGYGMGEVKFYEQALKPNHINDRKLASLVVSQYRQKFNLVCKSWRTLEESFVSVLKEKKKKIVYFPFTNIEVEYITFKSFTNNNLEFLTLKLPSGRKIYYPFPRLTSENKISYQSTRGEVFLWGGIILENLIQGLSRDVIREMVIKVSKVEILDLLFTEHDSIITNCLNKNKKEGLRIFTEIMNTNPSFIKEVNIVSEIQESKRFLK